MTYLSSLRTCLLLVAAACPVFEYKNEPSSYLQGARRRTGKPSEFERIGDMGYNAIRTGRHKYIQYTHLEGMDELYDLQEDPYELNNIIESPAATAVLENMRQELGRLLDD